MILCTLAMASHDLTFVQRIQFRSREFPDSTRMTARCAGGEKYICEHVCFLHDERGSLPSSHTVSVRHSVDDTKYMTSIFRLHGFTLCVNVMDPNGTSSR